MLEKLSYMLTTQLLENVEKRNFELEVYVYGMELILSTAACFGSILLSSALFSEFSMGIIFIIVFASLRTFTGGYHADTYRKCFIVTNFSYIALLVVKRMIWQVLPTEIWFILLVVATVYIWKTTPIINVAQPISIEKQKICSRNTKIILLIDGVSCLLSTLINKELMCMMILTICMVAGFMLVADKSMNVEGGVNDECYS